MSFQGNEAFKIDYGNGCTCEYTKSQGTEHSKWMSSMAYELFLNKAISKTKVMITTIPDISEEKQRNQDSNPMQSS